MMFSMPNRLHHQAHAITTGDLGHRLHRILLGTVNRVSRSGLPAHLEPIGKFINRDDLACAKLAEGNIEQLTHRPLADHNHSLVQQVR